MRIVSCIFVIGLLCFASCEQKTSPVEYKLTDEQLSNLLLDMQLTDVSLGEVNGVERDSLKGAFLLRMEEVYKHPMDELKMEIRKLESDPEKLAKAMDRVQVLLDSLR
jgi:hypothetical protein